VIDSIVARWVSFDDKSIPLDNLCAERRSTLSRPPTFGPMAVPRRFQIVANSAIVGLASRTWAVRIGTSPISDEQLQSVWRSLAGHVSVGKLARICDPAS